MLNHVSFVIVSKYKTGNVFEGVHHHIIVCFASFINPAIFTPKIIYQYFFILLCNSIRVWQTNFLSYLIDAKWPTFE